MLLFYMHVNTYGVCVCTLEQVNPSPLLLKLVNSLAAQEPLSKFKNESNKKSKSSSLHPKPLRQVLIYSHCDRCLYKAITTGAYIKPLQQVLI